MTDGVERVVFIAGPTASGKSAAALALAEALGGEIVNADAIQVYRDLEILSARPKPAELERAPHHLFGVMGGEERCSAGRWARAAAEIIAEIAVRGRLAIVVGGSGLYFRALEEGLSPAPEVPAATREAARRRLEAIGREAFRAEVIARDPAMAKLPASDTQRLLRAWEVAEASGEPLSAIQARARRPMIAPPVARIVIEPSREGLYAACDARFERMMEEGALDEARRLFERRLDPALPAMKALGAAELMAHLRNEIPLETAVARAKQNTRRFAKRQMTWFRHQAASWPRADEASAACRSLRAVIKD
ncbi:MAG: tRNA (adenosine(37)-N6)-dimethylallyltransferase MiaA [Alphaproteobacteria bacterium]|nr:tRNA (adenosine(37)-N6)-dimethylallyltransferase MiaA [Alphaproteobacteria bacterium]